MSRALRVLAFVSALWASTVDAQPVWSTGPVVTNPVANQVLISAGLTQGNWTVGAYIYSNIGVPVFLQHLDSQGTIVQSLLIPATPSFILYQSPKPFPARNGDSMRVIVRTGITGEAQAVLYLQLQ